MTLYAKGPPFDKGSCGNSGVTGTSPVAHLPYEFLPEGWGGGWAYGPVTEINLDKVCRETIEDLVKEKNETTLREDIMSVTNEFLRSQRTQVDGSHYEQLRIQPWEVFRKNNTPSGYCTYHTNTVMAYLLRHDKKGGLTDLKKAADHLRELIRYFEEDEEYPW